MKEPSPASEAFDVDMMLYAAPSQHPASRELDRALYGWSFGTRSLVDPDARLDFWADEFNERLRSGRDVVCLFTGPPGCGKSTAIIHTMRRMDERAHEHPTEWEFTPETMEERVAFKGYQVGEKYQRTPRYGAFFIDEAATADLMATGTHDPNQRDLVEMINIIRALNVALFIAIPDIADLAKSFRARRADYRVEIPDYPVDGINRGYVGQKVRGRKFFLDDGRWLGFSDDEEMNPIEWPEYRNSSDAKARALWDAYEPLKTSNLKATLGQITDRMRARSDA